MITWALIFYFTAGFFITVIVARLELGAPRDMDEMMWCGLCFLLWPLQIIAWVLAGLGWLVYKVASGDRS